MIYFNNDYMAGAHPEVMRRLSETNLEKTVGYGFDHYTKNAASLILETCGCSDGEVYFLSGGTQTNAVAISCLIGNWQGVMATDTSHINVHEAGAIEHNGHKVITMPTSDGKLKASDIEEYMKQFYADETWPHMVEPGMVYITHPTELGTLYSLEEMTAISQVCHRYGMKLYLDGARLGYGLAAHDADVTIKDISRLCDMFYIGGTKCGALFGEALVIPRKNLIPHFFSQIKQHGALFAKGRLQGIQFETLFTDGLYFRIARHAVDMAMMLRDAFLKKGYSLFLDSPTNQQFVTIPNDDIKRLRKSVSFEYWGSPGDKESVLRFVTDWSTQEEDVRKFISLL